MSKLRWIAAALAVASVTAGTGVASAATGVTAGGDHGSVVGRVAGHTYVLLGPSVFGVTVQQDPLTYAATEFADGTAAGQWRYDYWEGGQETTFSGPVTCLSVSGNRAWVGGPVTRSSDPAQVGMGAWWQVADNGTGRHPVVPDRTTFAGIGTIAQTLAYCANKPDPHFIFDVQLGGVQVRAGHHDSAAG
jgi:hypothetical protein